MEIRKVSILDIKPAPYNPRILLRPGDEEYESLKKSIETFGFVEPLVWNEKSGNLVSGHQRLNVLIDLGAKEVEVSVVNLSNEKERLLNLAMNRIGNRWDEEKLDMLIKELSEYPDLDLGVTGFTVPELSEILDRLASPIEDEFDADAFVESIKDPITKRGDIIELDSNRIMCGDTASEADLKSLMGDEKIDLVHMDPPYGCQYLAQNRPDLEARPKKSKRWEKLYKDDLNEEEYEAWLESVLKNIRAYLKDGASAYIWNGHAKFYFMHQVLKKLGFHISTVITWAKPNFAISYGDFNQQTEFCLYSWLKNGPHKWYGPTNETNLWEIDRDKSAELIHPTQKSVQIPLRAIKNSSIRDDVVFDGFLGSGSSLLASVMVQRRCYGLEIEPKYCDAIVRRYIAYVGVDKVSEDIRKKYLKES